MALAAGLESSRVGSYAKKNAQVCRFLSNVAFPVNKPPPLEAAQEPGTVVAKCTWIYHSTLRHCARIIRASQRRGALPT